LAFFTSPEGKQAVKMTRLSCHRFRSNQVRLALSVLAYNLGSLWRRLALPKRIENWFADESAATAGEDRRTAGATCTLLLAIAGGRTSEPAAVRGDAGPDRTATGADGIEREGGRGCIGIGLTRGWASRSVAEGGRKMEQSRQCWYGSQADRGAPDEIVSTTSELAIWAYDVCRFRSQKGNSG
jgi:hypothetical protein